MPQLGWITPNPAPPHTQVLVMASRFEVRSRGDVPRFMALSLASWRQVGKAPGAYGASLIARPLKRVFYTLSAWQDRDALYAYARTDPHSGAMRAMRPKTRESTFVFWESDTEHLPITWDEAMRRIEEKAQADREHGSA